MLNQNDKIERFAEVINKNAQAKCKKIQKSAEKYRKERLKEIETQSAKELDAKLKFELDRISSETNGAISSFQSENKLKIVARRDEITAQVFENAEKRLVSFAASSEYDAFLERSVKAITENFDGAVIIYARKADIEKVKALCEKDAKVKEVKESDKIKIGGIFASDENETVFADDTLEERLAAQKEWFMLSSGLAINE